MEIKISGPEALEQAAHTFVEAMAQHPDATVFAFEGAMGAGKTTFINALCRALGVESDFTGSPSFAIANEYRSDTTAELIYHFDLYRLENLDEALDIGFEDYLESGALCLIEWPGVVEPMLPEDTVRVTITEEPDGTRVLSALFPEE